mgnify:CR=1 FL=1
MARVDTVGVVFIEILSREQTTLQASTVFIESPLHTNPIQTFCTTRYLVMSKSFRTHPAHQTHSQ